MITPHTQILFCNLLKYFHHGNYATFKRVCELAFGDTSQNDLFFVSNLYLGSQLSGLIEIGENNGTPFWITSFVDQIKVVSHKPKSIGTTIDFFESHKATIVPLVQDWQFQPLILGCMNEATDLNKYSIFGSYFSQSFPSFADIEKKICIEESFRSEFGGYSEIFNLENGQWIPREHAVSESAFLLRVKKEFSGFSYYVVNSNLRILFRVLQPEWAFVACLRLLNWPLDKLIKYSADNLFIVRGMRLPLPAFRYLFASSSLTRIGPSIEFSDIDPSTYRWLQNYLSPGGESRHAA